ncbi:MAG: glycoside hydrolase family 3 C-terminal domain-containing protein [Amaricoccus sp.]
MTVRTIHDTLDAMTLEERVSLLSGEDMWSLPAVMRVGLGKLRVTDGPNGARGGGSLIGGVKSAAFPVGIALGATWNPDLVREIGAALAEETRSKGAHVLLGPTINLHRSVTNGRNFECYSEDPALTAALAVAYVTGLQSGGIAATPKHFVGNESEIQRTTMSSEIDPRSLRELYLAPFEAVVKAGTWAIMTSYNRLDGTYTSELAWLLTDVLRTEWGFDGVAMSDWFGAHSTAPTVNAGLDLEMPGPPRDRGAKLVAAVEAGEVDPETIRTRTRNVLRLMERTRALAGPLERSERADDRPEDRALIRRAGAEGIVLLKNDGILPLAEPGRIAVIGPNAKVAQIMGGGSAQLNPHYRVSPWDGLAAALGGDRLAFAQGCTNHRWEPLLTGEITVEFFDSPDLSGPVVHRQPMDEAQAFWFGAVGGGKVDPHRYSARLTCRFDPPESGTYRVGAFAAGLVRVLIDGRLVTDAWTGWQPGRTFFEEGCDEVVGTVDLVAGQPVEVGVEFATRPAKLMGFAAFRVGIGLPLGDAAIAEAVETARVAETALVFVGRNGEWDTEGSDLEDITLPGRQDELVAAVAAANPRTVVVLQTGGPVEMPWIDAVPAVLQAWYPGQEAGNAIADVLLGAADPGGRLPQTFPVRWADNPTASRDPEVYPGRDGRVRYAEGLFIGYRHYDRAGIAPLFPFGFGLSYTTFALDAFGARLEADGVSVTATVRNTGDRPGSTVLQIYAGAPGASVPRPAKELKAFAKLHLTAGEAKEVTLSLTARDFAYWDEAKHAWVVEPGRFDVLAGFSAADLPGRASVTVETGQRIAP